MPYEHDEPGKALILEGEISLRPADGETPMQWVKFFIYGRMNPIRKPSGRQASDIFPDESPFKRGSEWRTKSLTGVLLA